MNIDIDAALTYLSFVEERHRVWERRQAGEKGPWTADEVLASRKFTNVFRVLDPGSQFVLTDLYTGDQFEDLARCLLYRITNRPEAWRAFDGDLSLTHRPVEFRQHMHDYKASGGQVFSGAYMIWGGTEKGVDKIDHVFGVLHGAISGLAAFLLADTQRGRFEALSECRGMGQFNAMQVLTDFGYLYPADEDEFVMLGPGARRGAQAILGQNPGRLDDVHLWAVEAIHSSPECPMLSLDDYGENYRLPSYMDVQNTLCEFSKYVRYMDKPAGKPYQPAHPGPQPAPVLPKHW